MFPPQDSGMIRLVNADLRISMDCNLNNPEECASLHLATLLIPTLCFSASNEF